MSHGAEDPLLLRVLRFVSACLLLLTTLQGRAVPSLRIRIGSPVDPGLLASVELRLDSNPVDGFAALLPYGEGNDRGCCERVNFGDDYQSIVATRLDREENVFLDVF